MMSQRNRLLLVTGATGTLGGAFGRLCDLRGLPCRVTSRRELDIADSASIEAALDWWRPWAVINTAGYVRVDDAEREPERCYRENTRGPELLAAACASRDVSFVTFSSDLVFDGRKGTPFVESDPVSPLNVYGRSKAAAETATLGAHPGALIVRTSAFFGPWDGYNFVSIVLREIVGGRPFAAIGDVLISPTYVPDLVNAALDLLIDGERGVWHLANEGALTWSDLAYRVASLAGIGTGLLSSHPLHESRLPAPRPRYSVLGSERGMLLPPLEDALRRYMREREQVRV